MAKVDDLTRMGHMVGAAQKAVQFARGKQRGDLDQDELLSLALVRLLEMVGEAASKVSNNTRDQHPEIPWAQILGMRNRLVHGYDKIDLDVLWQTLIQDLQPLIDSLTKILGP